jgi:hemolysin activation/secretion protein
MNGLVRAQNIPDAGRILEGLRLPTPSLKNVSPLADKPEQDSGYRPALVDSSGIRISLKSINLTGFVVFEPDVTRELYADKLNKDVSLGELGEIARIITNYYRDQGFILARAYLPEQEIRDGVVEITILAGRFDKGIVNNDLSGLNDEAAEQLTQPIVKGAPVSAVATERATYLADDLPGIEARGLLRPGAITGTSDFVLDLRDDEREPLRMLNFRADNHGSEHTGKLRYSASMTYNNPSGWGDRANMQFLTTGEGVNFGSMDYDFPIGYSGTRGRLTGSYSRYALGGNFASLKSHGSARQLSANITHAIQRGRLANIYATVGYDDKFLDDRIDTVGSLVKKRSGKMTAGVNGNRKSKDGARYFGYGATFSLGYLGIHDEGERINDATSKQSAGSFSKIELRANYLQHLWDTNLLQITYSGQLAANNLDSSEKMSLGGANAVRAYPQGEGSGDDVHLISLELQHGLGLIGNGNATLIAFLDHGYTRLNHRTWSTFTGLNQRKISGTGIGLNWNNEDGYLGRAHLAHKLGDTVASAGKDRRARLWVEFGRTY